MEELKPTDIRSGSGFVRNSLDNVVSSAEEFYLSLPHLQELQRSTKSRRVEIRARRATQYLTASSLSPNVVFKHLYLLLNKNRTS